MLVKNLTGDTTACRDATPGFNGKLQYTEFNDMRYLWIIFIAVLSACTSTSGVVPLGNDTFVISRSQKGFDITGSRVKVDSIKEANQYCASMGKRLEITKTTDHDMVPFKSDAQAEIEFRCVVGS